MATTLFMRLGEAAPGATPSTYLSPSWTQTNSTAGGNNAKALDLVAGTSQLNTSLNVTSSSILAGIAQFISLPLAGQTISLQTWTMGIAMSDATSTAIAAGFYIAVLQNDGVTIRGVIHAASGVATTFASAGERTIWSNALSGTAVNVQDGDRLVVEVGNDGGTNQVYTVYADGSTAITANAAATSNARSFVSCPQSLIFLPVMPPPPIVRCGAIQRAAYH